MASSTMLLAATPLPEPYYSKGLRARFQLDATKVQAPNPVDDTANQVIQSPEYPDASYKVDEEKYFALARKRVAAGGLPKMLPDGYPQQLEGPLVWTGDNFNEGEDIFTYHLTDADKIEIGKALEHFKEQGLNGDQVSPSTFPLPGLEEGLSTVTEDIYEGRGFAVIRGLDPDAYTDEDFAIVYLGITSYVAPIRGKQDHRGSMLMHVLRRGHQNDDYNSDKPFHNDTVCDTLCLVTKSCSALGGRSVIASAWSVYNEIAATRPDLIHTLAAPDWPFDTYGRNPAFYRRAVMFYQPQTKKLISNLSRRLLLGHPPANPRTAGIPNVTEAQMEALDAIHFIARRMELRMTMRKGDIRLINNMAIMHRRESFEDGDSPEETRHLIRVWLHNEEMCWKLPAPLRLAWARVFEDGAREEHWDLKPVRKNGMVLRVAGSCD